MTGPVLDTGRGRPGRWCGWAPLTPGPWLGPDCGPCGRCCDAPRPEPPPRPARCATDPVRVEGQAADGADPLAHEAVVVLDVVDQVPFAVVDGGELIHGAAADRKGCQSRPRAGGDAWRQPAAGGADASLGAPAGEPASGAGAGRQRAARGAATSLRPALCSAPAARMEAGGCPWPGGAGGKAAFPLSMGSRGPAPTRQSGWPGGGCPGP